MVWPRSHVRISICAELGGKLSVLATGQNPARADVARILITPVPSDYEPLLVRFNEDDVYGDGNNFELAVTAAAAAVWRGIGEEVARRAALLELEAAHAAAEKAKPRSKRVRKVKPWQSMGSEVRGKGWKGGARGAYWCWDISLLCRAQMPRS